MAEDQVETIPTLGEKNSHLIDGADEGLNFF